MAKKITYLFFLLLIASACEENIDEPSGFVSLTIGNSSNTSGGRVGSEDSPKSILITVFDSESRIKFNLEEIPVFRIGDEFISENIEIEVGTYELREFVVLGQADTAIFVAPF